MIENISVRVVHFLQEGNILADFFTNLVIDFAEEFEYNNLEQVPAKGKAIIMLDKIGTTNITGVTKQS